MKIEYSLDLGKTFVTIADKAENSGAYLWRIPQDIVSGEVLIKVSDSSDASIADVSDRAFSIKSETN
jgi:hypothetical protein